eukprot:205407_1
MKLIISCILLCSFSQASRLLQAAIQQSCGGNGLFDCQDGYKCVANPSCPKDMFDCPGICVEDTPTIKTTVEPTQQRCGGNGLLECQNGYKCVADLSCPKDMFDCPGICVRHIIIPHLIPIKPICGVFDNCAVYYDGCNDCMCDINGEICTENICERFEQSRCIQCKDGYELNNVTGECRISCKGLQDCDVDNGYQCKSDPVCLSEVTNALNCGNEKVCLNVSGQCMFNGNCETDHKCVIINGRNGFCVKYQ